VLPIFSWYQNGENVSKWQKQYQMAIKYTKNAIKIPNGHRITKIFYPKAFKDTSKLAFLL
jgi:hypothetical protein